MSKFKKQSMALYGNFFLRTVGNTYRVLNGGVTPARLEFLKSLSRQIMGNESEGQKVEARIPLEAC